MVWYSHLFQNFPQFIVIHTVKGFGIVNKAEIDVFLELSCFTVKQSSFFYLLVLLFHSHASSQIIFFASPSPHPHIFCSKGERSFSVLFRSSLWPLL